MDAILLLIGLFSPPLSETLEFSSNSVYSMTIYGFFLSPYHLNSYSSESNDSDSDSDILRLVYFKISSTILTWSSILVKPNEERFFNESLNVIS